jgi:hypothetical protein
MVTANRVGGRVMLMDNGRRFAEGKANIYAEGTGIHNLLQRSGIEVLDILTKVEAALTKIADEEDEDDGI